MKRLPRDINAEELIKLLGKFYRYEVTRQSGSHIRLTSELNGQHHITIPNHRPLKLGTLSSILSDVANHHGITKEDVINALF